MSDILLAHSFFLRNDPKQVQKMRPYAPLGTLYAAGLLRDRGYDVALFDATLAEGEHEFEEALERHRPRFVALYEDSFNFLTKMCLTHAREAAWRMSARARAAGAAVLASSSDVTDHAGLYFAHGIEYALLGEADWSLVELLDILTGRRPGEVGSIHGLALPDPEVPGGVRHTPPRAPERRPDVFPFPAWDLVDAERYRAAWKEAHGFYSVNLVSTRGCPFHCNWCAKPIWGQQYAIRSPANLAEEMALVKRLLRPDHIWFADDIFGLRPHWVPELAREIEARDAHIPFMIQSRADLMTPTAVEGLARAGCVEVWLGAESGSQKILDAMDKGTTIPKIHEARKRLKAVGIKACFFLQFGYPGETFEDILSTVRLVREALPDDVGISVSYPLPGTKFHDMVKEELSAKANWEDSSDLAMMFQGTYQTPFYRKLHQVVHHDLDLRHRLASAGGLDPALLEELDRLNADWLELGRLEVECRSAEPTRIHKPYGTPEAPDLSKDWN
ncbi:MAG TPA: radical SAM protein [Thermoanaerobaculia bacterium]|nr:radical SAM protein [Thermoanaerobaculia bacterium]